MNEGELHGGAESVILSLSKDQFNGFLPFVSKQRSRSGKSVALALNAKLHFGYVSYCIFAPQHDILASAPHTTMSTVQEIKQAVRKLPLSKRLKVVKWVTAFDNDEWDKEISKDASSGKLDFLVREGKEALKKGRLQPFPRP